MKFQVKVPGKVAGKTFTGAVWELNKKSLEVIIANEDGNVECETSNGDKITLNLNELAKGTYIGDKYAEDNLDED